MSREARAPRGGGCLTLLGYIALMVTGGALLLVLVAMVGLWRTGDRFAEGLDTMFNPAQPTPVVDTRQVVVRQIQDASELTTTIFKESAIIDSSKARTLFGFEVGSTRLLYLAFGDVRAGVDLSEITTEDVIVISDTIRIRLPPPRILSSSIDVNKSGVYDWDRGLLGPDAPELQTLAEREALGQIVAAACEEGILEVASDRAELTVQQLLSVAGYREIIVESRAPPPGSCVIPR